MLDRLSNTAFMSDDFWTKIFFLGERIGLTRVNIEKMKTRGYVPPKHHSKLLKEAKKTRTPLPYEELQPDAPTSA